MSLIILTTILNLYGFNVLSGPELAELGPVCVPIVNTTSTETTIEAGFTPTTSFPYQVVASPVNPPSMPFLTYSSSCSGSPCNGYSLTVTGLSPGTEYILEINDSDCEVTACTKFPDISVNSSITCLSSSISWTNIGDFTYSWEIHTNSSFTNLYTSGSTTGNSINFGGDLTQSYYFRVRAVNGNCISEWEEHGPLGFTHPEAPNNLTASNITQSSFLASWNGLSCTTGYVLNVYNDSDNLTQGPITVSNQNYQVNGLPCDSYYFTVTALPGSNAATSGTFPLVPATPTARNAGNIQPCKFKAQWNASCEAESYLLYVYQNGSLLNGYPVTKTDLGLYVLGHNVTALTNNTTYTYKVKAQNTSGISPFSNTKSVTTKPKKPNGLDNESITTSDFTAKWNNQGCETGFELQISKDNNWGDGNNCPSSGVYSVLKNDTDYDFGSAYWDTSCIEDLQNGHTYYWRVRAVYAGGVRSGWSVNSVEIPNPASSSGRISREPILPEANSDKAVGDITIYPNPATSKVRFSIENGTGLDELTEITYTLFDQSGRVTMFGATDFSGEFDILHLPKGIYYLSIKYMDYQKIQRLVKE